MGMLETIEKVMDIFKPKVTIGLGATATGDPPIPKAKELAEAFNKQPWLRAVVLKKAWGVASAKWVVKAQKSKVTGKYVRNRDWQRAGFGERDKITKAVQRIGELESFPDHPILELLHNPNPVFSGVSVRALEQVYIEIVGESFMLVEPGTMVQGRMQGAAWWPMAPHWVTRTPTPGGRPDFELTIPGQKPIAIPMQMMLWHRPVLDPMNPYGRGSSTAMALSDELDAQENAAKLMNWAFYNRGRPDLLVTLPDFKPGEVVAFKDEWNSVTRGISNFFKSHFVNVDAKVQQLGQSFESMQLVDLLRSGRDNIRQVWGLPPEILGIIENSNRSTIDAADYLFSKHLLVPALEARREFYQEHVVNDYDDRILIDYVSPVQEDKNFQLNVGRAQPHLFTVDEWRGMAAHDPIGAEKGGGLYVMAAPLTAVENLMELVKVKETVVPPGGIINPITGLPVGADPNAPSPPPGPGNPAKPDAQPAAGATPPKPAPATQFGPGKAAQRVVVKVTLGETLKGLALE